MINETNSKRVSKSKGNITGNSINKREVEQTKAAGINDKRKYVRFKPKKSVKVSIKEKGALSALSRKRFARLSDISQKGMGIISEGSLTKGKNYLVEVYLVGGIKSFEGKVLHIRRTDEGYHHGIELSSESNAIRLYTSVYEDDLIRT